MLNSIITPLKALAKIGSIGTKFFALGMTGFGLKKMWSEEFQQKHTLPARAAFSSAYVLHMGSTTLATAAWFGSETISPPIATALVGMTSLMTSYANLMEAYISHSTLKAKHIALNNRLTACNLDLQRSLALFQSVNECETEIQSLNEQLVELNNYLSKIRNPSIRKKDEIKRLRKIFLALDKKYQEQINRNDILIDYFNKFKNSEFSIESVMNEIREKITTIREEIDEKNQILAKQSAAKTRDRIQNKIIELEQELKHCGIINIQCIRYIKIEEHIKLLEKLLNEIASDTISPLQDIERNYLENRINAVKVSLHNCTHPTEHQALNLDLGEAITLDQYINEDPKAFKDFLESSIVNHIELLQSQAKQLKESSEKIQQCFRLFIKQPIDDIQTHRSQIRNINQEMVALKCDISLEKLNEESRKTKLNFSTVASLLALMLCLLPQGELSSVLNPLMLSVGILGGASSLWQFYNRNLFVKKS